MRLSLSNFKLTVPQIGTGAADSKIDLADNSAYLDVVAQGCKKTPRTRVMAKPA